MGNDIGTGHYQWQNVNLMTAWRSPDNPLTIVWQLPEATWQPLDDHLMIVWWPPDNPWRPPDDCLTTVWRPSDNLLTIAWWPPDDRRTTAWRPTDDRLRTAWRSPDNRLTCWSYDHCLTLPTLFSMIRWLCSKLGAGRQTDNEKLLNCTPGLKMSFYAFHLYFSLTQPTI